MPEVIVERTIQDVSADRVWSIAKRLTDYPEFMEQVLSVEPCPGPEGAAATAWTVLFNGNELQWTETDHYDDERRRVTFQQIDGDLADWNGALEASPVGRDVLVRYRVFFDLGVPALAAVLHPLGERAIRDNCEQMLEEIAVRSVGVPADA